MGKPIEGDELLLMLRGLPGIDMDPGRARQVRERACTALARRQVPAALFLDGLAVFYTRLLEPVIIGAMSVGFLAWVVGRCAEALSQGPGILF